jgi:hypothetical protein
LPRARGHEPDNQLDLLAPEQQAQANHDANNDATRHGENA